MKKLISIIKIEEVNQCANLQTDYKIQRRNLKRYLQSLKIFKVRLNQNVAQIQSISKGFYIMNQEQSKSRKKASQIQYYMFSGVKIFGALVSIFKKTSQFYQNLWKKIVRIEDKIARCLTDHKKKYEKISEQHEKQVKSYASQCYPETDTILFKIGFVATEKIVKKQDSFRQTILIQQSKRYAIFLNNCLQQIQGLKNQAMEASQQFYSGAKFMWVQQIQQLREKLQAFQVDQAEVDKIADETGRVLTDRSIKSNQNLQENNVEQYQQQNQDYAS